MKREDLKVGAVMTFDDAQRFLLDKLEAADADNMIRFIRGQEARIQLHHNGWISVDEPPVASVGGMKEFNVVTRDQLGCQTVESAWYLNQYQAIEEAGVYMDGWYKIYGDLHNDAYYKLHTVTHWQALPPAPEQAK